MVPVYAKSATLKTGEKISLRLYSEEYKEALVKFYNSLSLETLRWALPPYDRARIEGWTSNPDEKIILLAIHAESRSDRVVGHLHIGTRPMARLKGIGDLLIYLHQDFQNKGLGTAMMREGIALAREKGLHKIDLTVVADNKQAIKVYEKVGFLHEGLRRDTYYGEDEKYHDQVDMGLIL